MTQNNTAQVLPVQLLASKFRIYRPRLVKPIREVKPHTLNYSNVSEFPPKLVKQQIAMFCREISALVKNPATVSINTDESGVNVTVMAKDFKVSLIYMEGGLQ